MKFQIKYSVSNLTQCSTFKLFGFFWASSIRYVRIIIIIIFFFFFFLGGGGVIEYKMVI